MHKYNLNTLCKEQGIHYAESELVWDAVKSKIIHFYGEAIFKSWFKLVTLSHYDNGTIFLITPSRFIRDWIKINYLDFIFKAWTTLDKQVIAIDLIIKTIDTQEVQKPEDNKDFFSAIINVDSKEKNKKSSKPLSNSFYQPELLSLNDENLFPVEIKDIQRVEDNSCFDKRFSFENFEVDSSNDIAYFACKRLAKEPRPSVSHNNPLFLYGGVGIGKTHLMHAIANSKIEELKVKYPEEWRQKVKDKILYLPSERFMREFVEALRNKNTKSFKEKFASADILMIDDIQFFIGKDCTQEEFFHIFNSLMDDGKQLVISADRSPCSLKGIEERMRSRLAWGLVADIRPGAYELRLGILKRKSNFLGVEIKQEVLEYLARNIDNNIRELEGALNKLIVANSFNPTRMIDIAFVDDKLSDMMKKEQSTTISINRNAAMDICFIQKEVSEYYDISLHDLLSKNRTRSLSIPRQIAMYLAKKLTLCSLVEIARKFGGKDHTTIIHGIKKIEDAMQNNFDLSRQIDEILCRLK